MKKDEGIKELIRLGVYQYLEKPVRFENLQSIFETIEKEQSFFENEKLRNELYKKQNKIQIINPTIKFDYYLNIFKKIL